MVREEISRGLVSGWSYRQLGQDIGCRSLSRLQRDTQKGEVMISGQPYRTWPSGPFARVNTRFGMAVIAGNEALRVTLRHDKRFGKAIGAIPHPKAHRSKQAVLRGFRRTSCGNRPRLPDCKVEFRVVLIKRFDTLRTAGVVRLGAS